MPSPAQIVAVKRHDKREESWLMRSFRPMRLTLLCTALLASAAQPALAQSVEQVDKRVKKLESEMRAVQRKVFPGGGDRYFEPEFQTPDANAAAPAGIPASSPVADLTARVDSLERQLATLTGQVEQANFRVRQMEEAMNKFRADAEYRLAQLEGNGTAAPGAAIPGATPITPPALPADTAGATTAGTTPPANGTAATTPPAKPVDPVEAEYRAAYAFVTAKDYAKAEPALLDFIAKHPKSSRASHAQYWLGRSYMTQKSHGQAAKAFLDNYRTYPKGDRAPDSLYWLGQALMGLNKPEEACRAYNELQAAYGAKLSTTLKDQVAKARVAAKCDA